VSCLTRQDHGGLVVLTGAGASKACGLPDMWEFAHLFHQAVKGNGGTPEELDTTERLLYGVPGVSAQGIPCDLNTDLEGLLGALLVLKDGAHSSDPAARLLTSLVQEWTNTFATTMEQLAESGTRLADQFSGVKSEAGVSQPDPGVSALQEGPLRLIESAQYHAPSVRGGFSSLPGAESVGGLSSQLHNAKNEIEKWKRSVDVLPRVSTILLEKAKELILGTYSQVRPEIVQETYEPAYAVMQKYARGTLDLFTLNYDPAIEIFCTLKGITLLTGFVAEGIERVWRNRFETANAGGSLRVRLYKLHGSVTWFSYDSKIIEVSGGFGQQTFVTLTGKPAQNMVIYPALSKETYSEPYASLMDHFRTTLRTADCCLVIGCSFRDEEVVSLLGHMTKENDRLHVIQCGMSEAKVRSLAHLNSLATKMIFMRSRFGEREFADELDAILGRLRPQF